MVVCESLGHLHEWRLKWTYKKLRLEDKPIAEISIFSVAYIIGSIYLILKSQVEDVL